MGMKMWCSIKPKLLLLSCVLLFTGNAVLKGQQSHPILSYFSAVTVNNTIQLNWAITGGNTCNGILIQRSTDGSFFETVGDIAGICGSPDVDVSYFFVDENPAPNTKNYYRLELGSQGLTAPVSIDFYPLNDDGYSMIFDRNGGLAYIYFNNPEQNLVSFGLFSIDGKNVLTGQTNDNMITIYLSALPAQVLIATISSSAGALKVKIPNF